MESNTRMHGKKALLSFEVGTKTKKKKMYLQVSCTPHLNGGPMNDWQ